MQNTPPTEAPKKKKILNQNLSEDQVVRAQTQKQQVTLNHSRPLVHSNPIFHLTKQQTFPINSGDRMKSERLTVEGYRSSHDL